MTNNTNISKTIKLKTNADIETDTIPAIIRIIKENHKEVKKLSEKLSHTNDQQCFINIWQWVRKNIKYQNDQYGKEQLRRPQRTVKEQKGDCDDMTILISSILLNLNYKHELIIAAYKSPDQWQHIYPVAYSTEGQRYVIDCVPEIPHFNYEVQPIKNQIIINMSPALEGENQEINQINQNNMKLEELGSYESQQSSRSDMFDQLISPISERDFLESTNASDEEEIQLLQGALGKVAMVSSDDDFDAIISGAEIEMNIYLRQLAEARQSLQNEITNPSEMSEINDNHKELRLIEDSSLIS